MKRFSVMFVSAAALVLLGAGCVKQPATSTSTTPSDGVMEPAPKIVVGVMLPFSGDMATYGESVRNAVQLAKKELKADNISFEFEDSKCEGQDAVTAINKLISVSKAVAVIGEMCSRATLAAAPIAEQNQVVMIGPGSTADTLTMAGDFIFRTLPADALQGKFGANLVNKKGYKKLAVIYVNDDYGIGFNNVLKKEFSDLGGTVVANETVDSKAADVRTKLTKIKNAKPDAIYIISNSPDTSVTALKQIKEMGVQAALFGSEGLKSTDIVTAAGAAAEGLMLTTVSAGTADFVGHHVAEYGSEPGPFAAQGYDAMQAIVKATKKGAATGPEIRDALYDMSFDGVSGRIDFDANGDLVLGNYDVLVVKDGKFIPAE